MATILYVDILAYSTHNLFTSNALWVKSGNRGNLKCLKVNNNFAVIFHRKTFILFLSDAKLLKFYDRFLGLIVYVKYLRSFFCKNLKGGSVKSEILCVGQLARAEKKSRK